MPAPSLSSYQDRVTNTQGQAVAGATVSVLSGQTDTVNTTTQPGSPLATIYADPYGNSQIPQQAVNLSGTVSTTAGSPNVSWASGNPLSQFLVGQTITINGVQYTVSAWNDNGGTPEITLATNAQSTGTFSYSATIPVSPLSSDDQGNFQFWTEPGYLVLQIYGPTITEQYLQGISVYQSTSSSGVFSGSGFGNGSAGILVTTTALGTGTGPANPQTVVAYLKVVFGGQTYWVPAMQILIAALCLLLFGASTRAQTTINGNYNYTGSVQTAAFMNAASGAFTNTQMNEYSQSLLNSCNPSSIFSNGSSSYFATDAATGCVNVPGGATVINANGLAGYGTNSSTATNLVGVYSNVRPLANNTHNWGMNPVCGDNTLGTVYTGTLCLNEIDTDISSTTTTGNGLIFTGVATVSNSNLTGVVIEKGGGTYPVYYTGFYCLDGATGSGDCLLLGQQASGNNQNSQVISFNSRDTGGTGHNCQLFEDSVGSLYDFACPIRYGETSASIGGQSGSELLWASSSTHTLMGNYNAGGAHPLYLEEVGSCSMSSGTTCTFAMGAAFGTIKGTFVSIDAASAPPATAIAAKCSASGTTATITAGASNSLTWDCLLKGQ